MIWKKIPLPGKRKKEGQEQKKKAVRRGVLRRRWLVNTLVTTFAIVAQAKKAMIDAIRHTMDTEFAGLSGPEQLHIAAAYTGDRATAEEWRKELETIFPGYPIHMDPLSLSVACHIGPGAQAVTVTKALDSGKPE